MIQVTEPNNEAVAILEALLERAKTGEIKELYTVSVVDDENHIVAFTAALSYYERLGMLEHLKMAQFETVEVDFE